MTVHRPKDTAAIITTDIDEVPASREDRNVIILVWRDCSMTIKFPTGARMTTSRRATDVEGAIQLAVAGIHDCAEGAHEVKVHRVPAGLTTDQKVLAWMQVLPGIKIEFGNPGKADSAVCNRRYS